MKFKLLLEDLLTELSGTEIYKKFYSKIEYPIFLRIIGSDPKTKIENNNIERLGKYSKMLLSMYQKGNLMIEDLDKAEEYLTHVYEHQIPLDVNKIKVLGDLYNIVKEYIAKDAKTFNDVLRVLPKEEYELLLNGNEWMIYRPLSEKASCYLGVNTEWCTTWGPYSLNKKHKDRGNMYQRYGSQGPLFIMVKKQNPDEKYQFHFESNQFMDKNDHRVNTSNFLNKEDNQEVLHFFFPSFIREVDGDEIKKELKRLDLLPNRLGLQLIEKSIGVVDNKLVNALISNDEDTVSELLFGISVNIRHGKIDIELDELTDDLSQLEQNIGWYEYESDHGWEFVYDDMRDRGIDEYEEEKLQDFVKEYYTQNSSEFLDKFSIKNFEQFINNFFDTYKQKDIIKESFWSDIADLSYSSYEDGNTAMVDEVKKDIDIYSHYQGGYTVGLNIVKFIQFLLKKGFEEIPEISVLNDVIDNFIDYCGHGGDFERIYDFNITYPKYNESNNLTKETDKFFENILEDVERSGECMKLRQTLNKIIDKYFNNYSKVYENEYIRVKLKSTEIDCDRGTVQIEYINKKTDEKYGGWNEPDGVKIENLVSLLTNYKLFESNLKLTNLI